MSAIATSRAAPPNRVPPLQNGDRLTRAEFERRYAAMPPDVKAELIEGVVYLMSSPVSHRGHGRQHLAVSFWIGNYLMATPGVDGGDSSTLRLDLDNEPQPDAFLRIADGCGGRSRLEADGYLSGSPELVIEVGHSSVSYDLHAKLNAYRRNGVQEYVVWRVEDQAIDWFVLREGQYERLAPGDDGIVRSEVLPGLWLDAAAMLRGDLGAVAGAVARGAATPEHKRLIEHLAQRAADPTR
jgi:Uma2 family endonuclease